MDAFCVQSRSISECPFAAMESVIYAVRAELFPGKSPNRVYADPLRKLGSEAFFCISATCFGCGRIPLFVVLPARFSNTAG